MNSDCGMFGDVILIFHNTEILIFFKKKRKKVLEETDSCVTVNIGPLLLFTIVSWFYVKPCSLTAVISN